jgi:type I restriction enzyme S subunit
MYGAGGQKRVPDEFFCNFAVGIPSIQEQTAIVAFLDRETGRIDRLIATQRRLIDLLKEKRSALISHAVTKGLNPNAPMKDSMVEWLGEVPEGWDVWKISHAFGSIGSGTTPPSDEPSWYDDGTVPWVTTGELREAIITDTAKHITSGALERFSALRLHPAGSLVIAMYGATIGRLGILGVSATTNQACCVLSRPKQLAISFVYFWLLGFKQQLIDLYATGGGQPNINQDIISGWRIPAPAIPEQTAIAAFLDRETIKIDALIAKTEKAIELAKERRNALISAAVTGKIDVRDRAIHERI